MVELKRPAYIKRDKKGRYIEIACKVCGTPISEPHKQSGRPVHARNYAEVKLKWPDGSMHVTNLCKKCVPLVVDEPEALLALYNADIEDMVREALAAHGKTETPKVVAVEMSNKGIL